MSLSQTPAQTGGRVREATEQQTEAHQKSLTRIAFVQMALGSLIFGMASVLLGTVLVDNSGHALVYSGIVTLALGAMAMCAGGSALAVRRNVSSPRSSATAKCMMMLHVCLCLLSIPLALATAAFSTKPTMDCLRGVEDCSPDAVKKGAWTMAILIEIIALILVHSQALGLFGKYGHLLGFSERMTILCRARDASRGDAEAPGLHQEQQQQQEQQEQQQQQKQQEGDDIPWQENKNWKPPSYEEAMNMRNEMEGGILMGVQGSCKVDNEDELPKYEAVMTQDAWRRDGK